MMYYCSSLRFRKPLAATATLYEFRDKPSRVPELEPTVVDDHNKKQLDILERQVSQSDLTHMHTHTQIYAHLHPHPHTQTHTHTPRSTHTHTRTPAHPHTRTPAHSHPHACAHPFVVVYNSLPVVLPSRPTRSKPDTKTRCDGKSWRRRWDARPPGRDRPAPISGSGGLVLEARCAAPNRCATSRPAPYISAASRRTPRPCWAPVCANPPARGCR